MVGERCTVMDLLTARNGAPPPPVQTKSTRNEGRKRSFWRWQRRALKAARDHEGREAAEAVQAAERNQQRAAQRRAKAAALDRKTAARHRRHRDCLLKQIKKGARLLNQQKEKRAAEERRKCRRQQHEEMLQRAAERKRRRRERHNLTAALAQRRHWRLGLKMLLLLVIFAAYLECAAAMPRGNVAAAAAGAGQRQRTLFSHGFSVSASSRTGIASTPGAGPPPPRDDGGGGTGSVVAGRDERDDGSSSEEEEARSEEEEEEEGELETAVTQLEERAARRKRQRKFPVVMDDVEKSVAVPAADSTVALTDEEKHILERLKGSFLFQQPLYPIETVECRGLDDEQTDHSHRHPFMTSWTAVRGLNFDMLYFRWHFGNWRLTQP